jgi:hypothetical protein
MECYPNYGFIYEFFVCGYCSEIFNKDSNISPIESGEDCRIGILFEKYFVKI